MSSKTTGGLLKKLLRIAPQRSLPALSKQTLQSWWRGQSASLHPIGKQRGRVFFFCDEFTNYNDAAIGQKAIQLLLQLGYEVQLIDHAHSGRAHISKGLLPRAKKLAEHNVEIFKSLISAQTPLIGVEPSAILSFRDEYPRLVAAEHREAARGLAPNCLMVEEFIAREAGEGRITAADFDQTARRILLHGHCHQKAMAGIEATVLALSLPAGHHVEVIPSGCCGMAGSFGYEKEHYEVSMQVGELVLLPAVRKASAETLIAAPGTSCRHQIGDGAQRAALHPVEILHQALSPRRI
jgi:Fe-S oxidoreductase